MQEVVQVARASGVMIADDFVERRMAYADTLSAELTSSMHEDLKRGWRLEVPWLSGDVVARRPAPPPLRLEWVERPLRAGSG